MSIEMRYSYRMDGSANVITEKSLMAANAPVLATFFTTILMIAIHFMIRRSKQQISARKPKTSKHQIQLFRYYWSEYLLMLNILITVQIFINSINFMGYLSLSSKMIGIFNVSVLATILFYTVFLIIKTGQSGSRLKVDFDEEEQKVEEVDDDKYWKLGHFYYNPNDPSFFIEKRIGIGWTLNFGRPLAVVVFFGFIIFIILYAGKIQ